MLQPFYPSVSAFFDRVWPECISLQWRTEHFTCHMWGGETNSMSITDTVHGISSSETCLMFIMIHIKLPKDAAWMTLPSENQQRQRSKRVHREQIIISTVQWHSACTILTNSSRAWSRLMLCRNKIHPFTGTTPFDWKKRRNLCYVFTNVNHLWYLALCPIRYNFQLIMKSFRSEFHLRWCPWCISRK